MLTSTADSAQFWRIGQNWLCYLAWPFHALFSRISCNTFLESLKHTDQPWVVFVSGAWNSIKNCLSLLCRIIYRVFIPDSNNMITYNFCLVSYKCHKYNSNIILLSESVQYWWYVMIECSVSYLNEVFYLPLNFESP